MTHTTQTLNLLLSPWNQDDTRAPLEAQLTIHGDKIALLFPASGFEAAFEMNNGQPRILVYTEGGDTPVSLHPQDNGLCLDTSDYKADGGRIFDPILHG